MWEDEEIRESFMQELSLLISRLEAALSGDGPGCTFDETKELRVVFHTLKGNASAVRIGPLERLGGAFEDLSLDTLDAGFGLSSEAAALCGRARRGLQLSAEALSAGPEGVNWGWVEELIGDCERLSKRSNDDTSVARRPVGLANTPAVPAQQRSERAEVERRRATRVLQREQTARYEEKDARSASAQEGRPARSEGRDQRYICRFRIADSCPLVEATLALARQRLEELGRVEEFSPADEEGGQAGVRAQVVIDADVGVLARALVLSHIDEVRIRRAEVEDKARRPAVAARRALMLQVTEASAEVFAAAEAVIAELARGQWEADALARAEIGLAELGIAAGALGFGGNAALSLEVAGALGSFASRPSNLDEALATTRTALERLREVGAPAPLDDFDKELAGALRRARGLPPATLIEGAWIAELPDETSLLEAVAVEAPWREITSGAAFLDLVRGVVSRVRTGRGRLRGAAPATMTTRAFAATFWVSSGATPVAFLQRETPEKDRRVKEASGAVSASAPSWGERTAVPLARLELLSLWVAEQRLLSPCERLGAVSEALEDMRRSPVQVLVDHLRLALRRLRRELPDKLCDVTFESKGTFDHRLFDALKSIGEGLLRVGLDAAVSETSLGSDSTQVLFRVRVEGDALLLRLEHDGGDAAPPTRGWPALVERLGGALRESTRGDWRIWEASLPRSEILPARGLVVEVAGQRVVCLPSSCHIVNLSNPEWELCEVAERAPELGIGLTVEARRGIMAPSDGDRPPVAWKVDEVHGYLDGLVRLTREGADVRLSFELADGTMAPALDLVRLGRREARP